MDLPEKESAKADNPAQATWGPVAAVLGTIGLFFASQIVGVILLVLVLGAAGYQPKDMADLLNEPVYLFIANLLAAGSLLALTIFFIRFRKSNLKAIGLKRFKSTYIGYALAGYGVYFAGFLAINTIIRLAAPHLLEEEQALGFSQSSEGAVLILIFFSLVIIPAVVEEVLFRGFLFSGLRKGLNMVWATLITSALFAAAHLTGGETSALLWVAAADTLILSAVMCYLRERSGSLWPPIILHGIKNGIAFVVLFIFKVG